MPVIISDDNTVDVVDVAGKQTSLKANYSPKFFHDSILTGKGGTSRGLLNEKRDPKMYPNGYHIQIDPNLNPGTSYNNGIKTYNIPCYMITPSLWDNIHEFNRPDLGEMCKIATRGTETIYLYMPIHAIQIEEEQIPGPPGSSVTQTSRDLSACMHMFLFSIKDMNNISHKSAYSYQTLVNNNSTENLFYRDICWNMFTTLRSVEATLSQNGYTVDRDAMNDFVQNYSIYTELCKSAEKWLTQASYYIAEVLVKNINDCTNGTTNYLWTDSRHSVFATLSRLEKYNIPLDQYQDMYDKMATIINPDILTSICKANLNLRLSNTLQHMHANRANLEYCPCNNHVPNPKIPYSKEQLDAIESTSPLTLVQSGAGTGKSTVILGRINHMIANGINPNDITILSFTNAAADHIKDLNSSVHSMTIASMLHAIYSNNFPTHQLSSLATIINSLDIYFNPSIMTMTPAQEDFIYNFKYILERLQSNNEYTRANNFVEDHLQETIDALDVIQQTSLELESIICYQKMDTLIEPPETQTKHLIIDEVQDNSISEFIYSIKYTDKHQCSMYIVGDCSQTLYEFRASNPKALNVLENSGVFATYKLQTNYRSNQEILDFANVLLGNIEANQYANIQLKANSLKPVTLNSFKDAVSMTYARMLNKSPNEYDNIYAHSVAIDTREYIQDKLDKGEQVAILAPARRTLHCVQSYLEKTYPGKKIVSLIPQRQYDNALFSKFIAKYWSSITYAPPANMTSILRHEIISKIPYLIYKKGTQVQKVIDMANQMIDEFEAQYANIIINWQNQVNMSIMTQKQMLDEIQKLLISFEIKRNNVAQALMSSKNAKTKNSDDVNNADFVISTIHSAKGLEFDNVVIYYASESESNIDEATKRMYYVAFTRARKTEFIFAYDTLARPKIQGDYEKIIKDLTAQNNASGLTDDSIIYDVDNDDINTSSSDDSIAPPSSIESE